LVELIVDELRMLPPAAVPRPASPLLAAALISPMPLAAAPATAVFELPAVLIALDTVRPPVRVGSRTYKCFDSVRATSTVQERAVRPPRLYAPALLSQTKPYDFTDRWAKN